MLRGQLVFSDAVGKSFLSPSLIYSHQGPGMIPVMCQRSRETDQQSRQCGLAIVITLFNTALRLYLIHLDEKPRNNI